ncbi:hypothetical protein H0H93_008711 [Arthromyces matolae]|nr:hypothetical protein H0H93_008711 [Arthromyces matolae]
MRGKLADSDSAQAEFPCSVVNDAMRKYLKTIPDTKRKKELFHSYCDPNQSISMDVVDKHLRDLERQSNNIGSSKLSKFFRRVFEVVKDFNNVVTILSGSWQLILSVNATNDSSVCSLCRPDALCVNLGWTQYYYRITFAAGGGHPRSVSPIQTAVSKLEQPETLGATVRFLRLKATMSSFSAKGINRLNEIVQKLKEKEDGLSRLAQILNGRLQQDWHREEIEKEINEWLHVRAKGVLAADASRLDELHKKQDPCTFLWITEHAQISSWVNPQSDLDSGILALYAPPGSGKSTLCAHTINFLLGVNPPLPVLYHFYQFDQPFMAMEILCHLASQLFRFVVSPDLCSPNIAMLQRLKKIVKDANRMDRSLVENILEEMVHNLSSPVWIFLDGLDEEVEQNRWTEVKLVLNFLLALSKTTSNVRLWNSSQNVLKIQDAYKGHELMDIDSELKMDMQQFLSQKLDISEDDRELVRTQIDQNGHGGFLWANMLIADLERATSPADKKRILIRGPSLDDYYDRFFKRIIKAERKEALDIFSLVAYSRRPLKIGELQEAVAVLRNKKLPRTCLEHIQNIQHDDLPFTSFIKRVCSPLIIFKANNDNTDERMELCHLYHSTILRFLRENDYLILNDWGNPCHQIGHQEVIADACIKYLLQSRYRHELKIRNVNGKEDWTDSEGNPISDHRFLSYAAKYWDKHRDLDEVMELSTRGLQYGPNRTKEGIASAIHSKIKEESGIVQDFLQSSNFRTCLQIQSLRVRGQFFLWTDSPSNSEVHFRCLKRVFPNWLDYHDPDYWTGYGQFCSEWITVLCGSDHFSSKFFRTCQGEIDRCWWEALGSNNFLNQPDARRRYPSFRFQRPNQESRPSGYICSMVAGTGMEVGELHVSVNGASAHTCLDRWSLLQGKFEPIRSQELSINKLHLNLEQYTLCPKCLSPRHDRAAWANLVYFDYLGNSFRLGSQIYLRGANNMFQPLAIPGLKYVEEISSRGSIVVITRRKRPLKNCDLQNFETDAKHICGENTSLEGDAGDVAQMHYQNLFGFDAPRQPKDDPVQISTTQSFDDRGTSSESTMDFTSDSESSGDAYESWSECSSESHHASDSFEQNEDLDDGQFHLRRSIRPGPIDLEDSNSEGYQDSTSSSEGADDESDGPHGGSSSDSEYEINRRDLSRWQIRPYGEEELSSDEEFAYYGRYAAQQRRKSSRKGTPYRALMRVYNAESTQAPLEIFSFSTGLQLPLNDSPPVIHPTHSLIVWPLSGGKLLFADFEASTYFVRKLKASTSPSELPS